MVVAEDFESRPHKAVPFVVEREKEIQEWNEQKGAKRCLLGHSGGRLPGGSSLRGGLPTLGFPRTVWCREKQWTPPRFASSCSACSRCWAKSGEEARRRDRASLPSSFGVKEEEEEEEEEEGADGFLSLLSPLETRTSFPHDPFISGSPVLCLGVACGVHFFVLLGSTADTCTCVSSGAFLD